VALAVGEELDRLVLQVAPAGAKVLQLLPVHDRELLDGVDVLRAQFGATARREERRVIERRARLGLRGVRLELLVLVAEPLRVGDLMLLASISVDEPVRPERVRRLRCEIARARRADVAHLHVFVDRPAFGRAARLVLLGMQAEQDNECCIGVARIDSHSYAFLCAGLSGCGWSRSRRPWACPSAGQAAPGYRARLAGELPAPETIRSPV